MLAIGVVFTPVFARLVRGQTLSVRERDFVMAARALGAGPGRVTLRHIWPNVTAPIIVQTSLLVASAIVVEAALSFLGLGIEPPTASWGSMLKGAINTCSRRRGSPSRQERRSSSPFSPSTCWETACVVASIRASDSRAEAKFADEAALDHSFVEEAKSLSARRSIRTEA